MTTMVKRAAIYTRVSSEEQAQEGTSLDTQRDGLTAWAAEQGWTVVGVYEERAVSGAKTQAQRPALSALMDAARAGQVDVLVVDKWDRLARNLNEQTTLWGQLDDLGVEYVSRAEPASSGKDGKFVRHIMAAVAEQERDRIRDRTRAGLNARVRGGGWGGGNVAPFGYKIVGVDSAAHLEVDEREATVVRQAVAFVLDEGLSTLAAARRLNALGLTPRNVPLWTSQNLRNCLRRGQWAGFWTFGKTSPKGSVPEPIVVPLVALLDPERAEALKRHLEATSLVRTQSHVHPLTGRLICMCGQPMTGIARSDRANRRYRCRHGRHIPGLPFCSHPSLLGKAVDDAVWVEVLALLTRPDLLMALAQERLGMLDSAQEVTADALQDAERALERTQRALAGAAAKCMSLDLDEATTRATLEELREQHRQAVQHRAMVASVSADTAAAAQRMVTAQDLAEVALTNLVDADRDMQAKVFRLLDVRVIVTAVDERVHLSVEGSVVHDLLLHEVREAVAPSELASAAA